MDVFKLRLKIGVNEFEAEGSEDYIKFERQIFLESIIAEKNQDDGSDLKEELGNVPTVIENGGGLSSSDASGEPTPASPIRLPEMSRLAMQHKSDKDLIVLTALPQDAETQKQDALLLLLLAHKIVRGVDNVKSTDALNGMKQSGLPVDLAALADKMPTLVLKTGVRKGTKYRLSTPGVQKATSVATALLSHVG
jgi:hypothetical protein